ncbi:MAG: hypothetical protein M3Y60_08265, partial [Bacteroidota bacterium]|nr:hypothetical protein [Bacteroidota bacterium]
MKKINLAIWLTTMGLLSFIVLCSLGISLVILQLYFFVLIAVFIRMVIIILKNGEPSIHTFEERFYEDE